MMGLAHRLDFGLSTCSLPPRAVARAGLAGGGRAAIRRPVEHDRRVAAAARAQAPREQALPGAGGRHPGLHPHRGRPGAEPVGEGREAEGSHPRTAGLPQPGPVQAPEPHHQNCGRSVIQSKLADIEQRFGITSTEVNPAYTSRHAPRAATLTRGIAAPEPFRVPLVRHKKHADLNAAENVEKRRALLPTSLSSRRLPSLLSWSGCSFWTIRDRSGSDRWEDGVPPPTHV